MSRNAVSLLTPRCAKIESASSAIFRATVQPRRRSVAPAAATSVLENGISTATRTCASTRFVRERRHPPHVTCRTKKLAGAQPAAPAPRAPRPAGQRLGPRLGGRGAPGVPQFVAAAPGRAGARRFNRARTHVPDTGENSRGERPPSYERERQHLRADRGRELEQKVTLRAAGTADPGRSFNSHR
jgi:hypothetical protein